jgi:hypothetical protein
MRLNRLLAVATAAVLTTGCWHATVTTGRPAGAQVIQEDWHTNWFFGLIAGPAVDASSCKGGVAMVETQHSFLNMLVNAFVGIIWSPMTVTVTCASGGTASISPTDKVIGQPGASLEETKASFKQAAQLSAESGTAVFVRF